MLFLKKDVIIKTTPRKECIRGIISSLIITLIIYILLSMGGSKVLFDVFNKIVNNNVSIISLCLWLLPIIIVLNLTIRMFKIMIYADDTK